MTHNAFIAEMIAALRHRGETDIAAGVEACARYARLVVPARGLLMPMPEYAGNAVENIALEYFGLQEARGELEQALAAVEGFKEHDAIETAARDVCTCYDATHYYLGIANAFAMITFGRTPQREHPETRQKGRRSHALAIRPRNVRRRG